MSLFHDIHSFHKNLPWTDPRAGMFSSPSDCDIILPAPPLRGAPEALEESPMSKIHLQSVLHSDATVLSNQFIDQYMPHANGEFVKVYIYLLRCLSDGTQELKASRMADRLLCTEGDIIRALKYWEGEHLLTLHFSDEGDITEIALGESKESPGATVTPISAARKNTLSADRIKELKENEDVAQLLFITEKYLARPLSPAETRKILYFYDELHMSVDLIDYLIEYCVEHGHKNMHYIETVAHAWSLEGITTVKMAKNSSSRYRKDFFTILKAMGISGRNPVETEIRLMEIWLGEYGFPMEVILEACCRTVMKTGQASFQYADRILASWYRSGVKDMKDIQTLDEEHQKKAAQKSAEKEKPLLKRAAGSENRFNNFPQREYDFDEFEKQLLKKS